MPNTRQVHRTMEVVAMHVKLHFFLALSCASRSPNTLGGNLDFEGRCVDASIGMTGCFDLEILSETRMSSSGASSSVDALELSNAPTR